MEKMNKKSYVVIGILLVLGLFLCAGCSAQSAQQEEKYTAEDLDNLAEIRIYSAEDNALIKTINDEDQLYQYNQCLDFDETDIEERQDELKQELEGAKEQYALISYKYPAARFGDKDPEENITITLYEDTNIVKMTVSKESIKNLSLPEEFLTFYEEFLTFYYELSDEEIGFYRALAE